MPGKLYVVGTPIGNLEDISARAIRILSEVDFIAAEDTRVTIKLLNHFNIKKPMISYFEHNKITRGELIIEKLLQGQAVAIVTDAGMPAISDPGEELVREAIEKGIPVESVPGPSALTAALSISGMESRRFCFEGFLPQDKKERKERLLALGREERTMVFYEAPHRLLKTLDEFYSYFGNRNVGLIKEITKAHETVLKMSLEEAVNYYKDVQIKGEYVIIVSGAEKNETEFTLSRAVDMAMEMIANGDTINNAAKSAAQITGIKKSDIYNEVIKKRLQE